MNAHLYALILAGGGGTRLWPKSREKTPKQFLKLGGEKTLLRATAERIHHLVDWNHTFVITNIAQLSHVQKELPEIAADHIICEPQKRETAMAMAVGALAIAHKDPDAVVMNFASDHVVANTQEFIHVMELAAETAADHQHIVTVGISPTFPHTGLGYIKIGAESKKPNRLPIFSVENFTEKPNLATATAFLATGKYFWNANNYVWSCRAIEEAFAKYAPETAKILDELKKYVGQPTWNQALETSYQEVESISIDYAISEKADNLVLIPGDFGWNDVGDWKVVYDLANKNAEGNVVLRDSPGGDLVQYRSRDNLINVNGRLVALVGLEDMIVIDTDEILLVMPKNQSQDVKKIVEQLKQEKKTQFL